jgi:hypothetical protein
MGEVKTAPSRISATSGRSHPAEMSPAIMNDSEEK